MSYKVNNDKGFSLIELIVVIAIMVVVIGMSSMSLAILTGSDAKQACEKISAHLNEAKTGAMTRQSEDINIIYVSNPDNYDWADKEGYYSIKQLYTFEKNNSFDGETDTNPVTAVPIGQEHRYLCNGRVEMVFSYGTSDTYTVGKSEDKGIKIEFDRTTGLYKGVNVDCKLKADGSVELAPGVTLIDKQPKTITFKSGFKTYTIEFISGTGKHRIIK